MIAVYQYSFYLVLRSPWSYRLRDVVAIRDGSPILADCSNFRPRMVRCVEPDTTWHAVSAKDVQLAKC